MIGLLLILACGPDEAMLEQEAAERRQAEVAAREAKREESAQKRYEVSRIAEERARVREWPCQVGAMKDGLVELTGADAPPVGAIGVLHVGVPTANFEVVELTANGVRARVTEGTPPQSATRGTLRWHQ